MIGTTSRQIYEYWVSHRLCGPRYWDTPRNAKLLNDWIDSNRDGVVSLDTLSAAEHAPEVANHLNWKPQSLSASEIQAKAAEEKMQKDIIIQNAVIEQWLRDECPTGLLVGGRFYPEDANKITAFVVRNHGGNFTPETLRVAVRTLTASNALTYWDRSPEATQFRNQPAPPPRKLSQQAMREAGILPEKRESHTDSDGQFVDPSEKLKTLTKRILGQNNPWQAKAEGICVQGRNGRIDQVRTHQLRETFAHRGTEIDWEATYNKRNELADQIDRLRNRD